ncbi:MULTISPECIES: hypothetical protein [Nocardia]|uniref:hypothetical protein n=1 Tax=Nocardia TaxID=1817 RepID=UPI000D68778E|nr:MULTISPECIES: hypothetical protein [Nocardia]
MNVTGWAAVFGYAVCIGVPLLVLLWCVWPERKKGPTVDDIVTRVAHQNAGEEPHRDGRHWDGYRWVDPRWDGHGWDGRR